jgi:Arc/MetJ family transcription regulator
MYGAMIYFGMKRTTIFLGDQDREAIRLVQHRYGVSTDSDAIRLALRVLAEAKEISISPLPQLTTSNQARSVGKYEAG